MTTSTIMTETLITAIRKRPLLPRHTWYFVSGVTLSALNRPEEIPIVYRHAIERSEAGSDVVPSHDEKLEISRKMREALIKSAPICGLPKTINALFELKKATPVSLLDEPLAYSPTERQSDFYDVPSSHLMHRGKTFFDKIYGKVSARVMSQMDRSGTEDLGLVARLMYGYVLSNTRVLSPSETSLVLLAGLIPQDVNAQLKGHLKGATHHTDMTLDEIKAVRDVVIEICEASGMRRLDQNVASGWGWRGPIATL